MELEFYIRTYFGISKANLEKVVSLFEYSELKKGEFYTKKDQYCGKLSFVESGIVRIYGEKEHKEITQWISTKGHFITDLSSLIFKTPARFNIQALSDTKLFTINKENYDKIGQEVSNWHELEKIFIAKCFITLENRVFDFLSMSAEERYLTFFENNKELFHQIPQIYLASMLGMTAETLSRIRAKKIR